MPNSVEQVVKDFWTICASSFGKSLFLFHIRLLAIFLQLNICSALYVLAINFA